MLLSDARRDGVQQVMLLSDERQGVLQCSCSGVGAGWEWVSFHTVCLEWVSFHTVCEVRFCLQSSSEQR
jgi:hypothetical protein